MLMSLVIGGCTTTTIHINHVQTTLQRNELGRAATCEWHNREPYNCVLDTTRATINLDCLNETVEAWQRCLDDEYDRRKL